MSLLEGKEDLMQPSLCREDSPQRPLSCTAGGAIYRLWPQVHSTLHSFTEGSKTEYKQEHHRCKDPCLQEHHLCHGVICVMVSFVPWCHLCHSVICIMVTFVSWCHLCHGVIWITVTFGSWYHLCYSVICVMLSLVSQCHL